MAGLVMMKSYGQVYNVDLASTNYSINEIADMISDSEVTIHLELVKVKSLANTDKRETFGWKPKVTLSEWIIKCLMYTIDDTSRAGQKVIIDPITWKKLILLRGIKKNKTVSFLGYLSY